MDDGDGGGQDGQNDGDGAGDLDGDDAIKGPWTVGVPLRGGDWGGSFRTEGRRRGCRKEGTGEGRKGRPALGEGEGENIRKGRHPAE